MGEAIRALDKTGMCTKLNLCIEKKTPYRVLFIRAAESMIAVVFRQAIDMTAREGDQDWS